MSKLPHIKWDWQGIRAVGHNKFLYGCTPNEYVIWIKIPLTFHKFDLFFLINLIYTFYLAHYIE